VPCHNEQHFTRVGFTDQGAVSRVGGKVIRVDDDIPLESEVMLMRSEIKRLRIENKWLHTENKRLCIENEQLVTGTDRMTSALATDKTPLDVQAFLSVFSTDGIQDMDAETVVMKINEVTTAMKKLVGLMWDEVKKEPKVVGSELDGGLEALDAADECVTQLFARKTSMGKISNKSIALMDQHRQLLIRIQNEIAALRRLKRPKMQNTAGAAADVMERKSETVAAPFSGGTSICDFGRQTIASMSFFRP
jgi:hypothetical protein